MLVGLGCVCLVIPYRPRAEGVASVFEKRLRRENSLEFGGAKAKWRVRLVFAKDPRVRCGACR